MLKREDIRYHARWVRLVCCLAVAVAAANAVYFRTLSEVEALLRSFLAHTDPALLSTIPPRMEIALVFGVCLVPAIPRIERPLLMVAWGIGLVAAYLLTVLVVLYGSWLFLPLASCPLGLLGSTALLETMAWSEERTRRRALERLEEARHRLTDMLVHDLKKRMSSIQTSVSLLERRLPAPRDAAGRELVTTIKASADRMLGLISDLLDIRRSEEGRLPVVCRPLDLAELLADSVRDHRPAADLARVRLEVAAGTQPLQAHVDRQVFGRVLANLLWNAIQHAPRDTDIEIACAAGGDGGAVLSIANRGPVIPAARRDALFRSSWPGLDPRQDDTATSPGLGLPFCKLAVEAHGGGLQLDSPWPGHDDGVRVTLRLPPHPPLRPRNLS